MGPAGTALEQNNQRELQRMAYTDHLTGLGNRNRLADKIRQLAADRAADPAPFTVGIVNLDGFKPINDLFGQASGDEILCQVAHRLKACVPDGATVTRHDGDEFAIVLPLVFERTGAERAGRASWSREDDAFFDRGPGYAELADGAAFAEVDRI